MWGEALAGRILRCRKNSSCLRKWQENNEQYQEPQSRLDYWRDLRGMGGCTLGVLHYLVNLRPRQKARTPRLIPDALLALPVPRGESHQRAQVGNAEASIGS